MAAKTDSRDPPRSPATTKPMASVFARRDGDTGNSTRTWAWDWALECCYTVLDIYHEDGDIKKARSLLRDALSCGAHLQTIFLAWISMEEGHGDFAAARACFEEWRSHGGGGVGDHDFWCHYTTFELLHGTAARARAVAEAAMAACPRDPVVFAMYAKMELRLGCNGRARHVVKRAREIFTADVFPVDEDAVKWITNDVERYRQCLREAAARPTIGDLFRFFFFCGRGG